MRKCLISKCWILWQNIFVLEVFVLHFCKCECRFIVCLLKDIYLIIVFQVLNDSMENEERKTEVASKTQDPIQSLMKQQGFLLLWKQMEIFKESWTQRQTGVEKINTTALFKHLSQLYRSMNISLLLNTHSFIKVYGETNMHVFTWPMILCCRVEVYFPSMQALAQQMDKEGEYEILLSQTQSVLPPPGAAEVDVKTWQVVHVKQAYCCWLKVKLWKHFGNWNKTKLQ